MIRQDQITLLAIDPGKTGALAWADTDGEIHDVNMPETVHEVVAVLRALDPARVVIEKVGFHRVGNNAQTSATFARHVGELHGVMAALHIPFIEVATKVWQSWLGEFTKGSECRQKKARKREIQDEVQKRTGFDVHVDNADAVGILLWGQANV